MSGIKYFFASAFVFMFLRIRILASAGGMFNSPQKSESKSCSTFSSTDHFFFGNGAIMLLFYLVPGARLELATPITELRSERSVYTNFTIRAEKNLLKAFKKAVVC